jgi:hypothetical protein
MNQQDYRDYFVLVVVTFGWIAATVFLFMNQSSTNFGIWSGLVGTVGSIYHFLSIADDKRVDNGVNNSVLPDENLDGAAAEQRDWIGGENASTTQTDSP